MFLDDDDVYRKGKYCGVRVPLLNKETANPRAQMLLQWIDVGVADAIETGHAQKIYLNVHDVDPFKAPNEDNVIEQYSFIIACGSSSIASSMLKIKQAATKSDGAEAEQKKKIDRIHGAGVVTKSAIKKQLKSMLRRLMLVTEAQDTLPDRRWITMNIVYRDDTPLAYEPSGFEAVADVDLARFKYEHITLRCGQASTGHHTIALKARMIDNEAKGLKEADNPAFETPRRQERKALLFDSDGEALARHCGNKQKVKHNIEKREGARDVDSDEVNSQISIATRAANITVMSDDEDNYAGNDATAPMVCSQDSLFSAANENNVGKMQKPRKISRTKRSITDVSGVVERGRKGKRIVRRNIVDEGPIGNQLKTLELGSSRRSGEKSKAVRILGGWSSKTSLR